MNGRDLTLGLVGALAVGAALGRRGSRATDPTFRVRSPAEGHRLIASKVYQTGFKDGKSTAIHASRLLNEVHGLKKRKFNLLIDLQKAYDSVDRVILWKLLKQRCKSQ